MKFDYKTTLKLLTSSAALILIACTVSLATLILGGARSDIFTKQSSPNAESPSGVTLSETPDYGQNYINSMIFLGDKSIYGIIDAEVLTDGKDTRQVWIGKNGDIPLDFSIDKASVVFPESGKEISVSSAISQKKPEYILITLGISNGVSYCSEESFKAYYGKLITALKDSSPNTKIILQSIIPVSKDYEKSTSGISVEKIRAANLWIKEIAEENGVRYLDTYSTLSDKSGYLLTDYDSGNGVALNQSGYNAMLTYIRTHGYK